MPDVSMCVCGLTARSFRAQEGTWYAFFFSIEDGDGKPAAWGLGSAKPGQEMEEREKELEAREKDVEGIEQQRAGLTERERETGVKEAEQKDKEEGLAGREREVEAKQTKQREAEQQLEGKTEKLAEKEKELGPKEKELGQKGEEVAEKEKEVAEKEKEIVEKEKELAEKEKELAEKEKELAQKEKELAQKQKEGCPRCQSNRDVVIQQKERLQQQADTIEDLKQELAARGAESKKQEERLSKQADELAATKAKLRKYADDLAAKEAELAGKQQPGARTNGNASAADNGRKAFASDNGAAFKREADALKREAELQHNLAEAHKKAREYAEKEAAKGEHDLQQVKKAHEKLRLRLAEVEKRLGDAKKAACPDPSEHAGQMARRDHLERLKRENERFRRLVGQLVQQQQDAREGKGRKTDATAELDDEYQRELNRQRELNARLKSARDHAESGVGRGSKPADAGTASEKGDLPAKKVVGESNGGRTKPSGGGARQSADGKPLSTTGNAGRAGRRDASGTQAQGCMLCPICHTGLKE